MKHDVDLFLGLAEISEKVALTALDELCAKKDRPAIEAFMEAVKLRPRLFPKTLAGKKMRLHKAGEVLEAEPTIDRSAFDMIALTVQDFKRAKPLTNDQLSHFEKIVGFASHLVDTAGNQFNKLGKQMARYNTDPAPLKILVEAAIASGQHFDNHGLAASAISQENYGAVLGLLGKPDDGELIASMPDTVSALRNALTTWAWSLTQGVAGSPGHIESHKLLRELEERVGIDAIAPLRIGLLAEVIKLSKGTDPTHRNDDFLVVSGLAKPDSLVTKSLCKALDDLHKHEPSAAYAYVHSVLEANLVELLPSIAAHIGKFEDSMHPKTDAGTALDGAFSWADGPKGARRLQETLEYLSDHGHDLNDFGTGTTPITHISLNRREHRMKTLAVLLEMGFDPLAKDSRGRLAEKYVCDEDKAAWNHIVNAHKARATAHSLLNEIDLSP